MLVASREKQRKFIARKRQERQVRAGPPRIVLDLRPREGRIAQLHRTRFTCIDCAAMSRKQIRTASSPTVATEPSKTREVDKLIQKGRLKDAVKAAKLCFKEDGTPENHQLLERAYFLRARQLLQLGMADSAREVAGHLLEFGLTTNEWTAELLRLLVSLGLSDHASRIQAQSDWPELTDELLAFAADMAVIHPERTQNTPPEIAPRRN